ncbi:phosphate acetyltransferase [Leptolyngbya sp. NK1-12]|uniref:Phosphate acetyltransferase n=1 Tax=Leptolyngbya sp. NK1-12 TaxID=2547451 RepID=A0AA97AH20_9CYAN|nr:phosphate acetyltransferase [Leptolyngbya sp. NK1-12]WNZ24089.1 phosphate acetyltransferase [Leptolyngbya sp. NK1-12]
MLKNLYIVGLEPGSGKALVALGIMELLSKRVHHLGFFRPVIHSGTERDNDIELVRSRYPQNCSYEAHYALMDEEVRQLIAAGQYGQLLQQIISAYKHLEQQCDFVVCEGIDSSYIDSAFVDNFDSRVANHLAAPILLVANGANKTPTQVVNTVLTEREAFLQEGCAMVATIINRVAPDQLEQVKAALQVNWTFADPIFVLPDDAMLSKPTIAEIAKAIDAKLIHGDAERLNHEVMTVKAAAMQLPNFLGRLQEGSLVITPGDRSDVILGCLASTLSSQSPNVAGMVLTGGLDLDPRIQQLIQGARWTAPILSVTSDTYQTATQINEVRAEITPHNARKIASALGLFEAHVDTAKLAERIAVSRSTRMTPIMFEYELVERAKASRQHIVLPEGNEERILRASEILLRRGVVDITLLGDEQEIRTRIDALGLKLEQANIINPLTSEWQEEYGNTYYELRKHKGITEDYAHDMMKDVSYFGTMMVYKGIADGMVSGSVHTTAHTIRPALEFIRTQPGVSIVSSVFFMCLEDRVLVYGDCAVNPDPNPQQLADIAISSAMTAQQFGVEPLVAMLSYSTGTSGQGAEVEKVKEATRIARQQRPDLKIEGPIQYDAAIDESVAKTKLPGSEVAGHATVFIFPDLNTGNNTYKAVQRSANAVAIGPVLQGLKKPVNDLSRGCTIPDIVNTVAITAIQAQSINHAITDP